MPPPRDRAEEEEKWYELVEEKLRAIPRRTGHDRRTLDEVFDRSTMMTLYKFLSNEMISSLDFPVSTGKEANVFRASTHEGGFLAVKIYRTSNATFHDILKYIQGDPRFHGLGRDRRGLIHAWAQKEYRNLGRCIDSGVRVPEPVGCLENILVMEYLGTEEGPSPRIKDVPLEDPQPVAEELVAQYRRMLAGAGLVHADLSEFNVLWHEDEPFLIDVGQAVLLDHPMASEFFERDVKNLFRWFRSIGAEVDEEETHRSFLDARAEGAKDLARELAGEEPRRKKARPAARDGDQATASGPVDPQEPVDSEED